MPSALRFACPQCRGPLDAGGDGGFLCRVEALSFPLRNGYLDFLTATASPHVERFLHEYTAVRRAEGWGSDDSAYYRALPYSSVDVPGYPWRMRARSYEALRSAMQARGGPALGPVLDAGSGNGWLGHRLAGLGYRAVALDLSADDRDGLAAAVHFNAAEPPLLTRAHFDRLPLAPDQFAWVIYNASFHYTADFQVTLREACRVLRAGGWVAIADSPTYRREEDGRSMVRERKGLFRKRFGFPSDALGSCEFLTAEALTRAGEALGLRWTRRRTPQGWRRRFRALWCALRGARPPADFPLWLAQKPPQSAGEAA